MAYWAVSRVELHRERLALHCLGLAGFETYLPRLRDRRVVRGRRIEVTPPLFPGYLFILIQERWWDARWCPGTLGLIMNGAGPAHVPDAVVDEIRRRERNGAIVLPRVGPKPGDRVRLLAGPFQGHLAIYAGMSGLERVAVLLSLLGGERRITLARRDVEAIN
jgi:transcriptional antiterminator RfaH